MNARLLRSLKYPLTCSILLVAFIVTSVPTAEAEALFLFRSKAATAQAGAPPSSQQKSLLKVDEKGDLLIQCGCAHFTVAYNSPTDQLKPSDQQPCSPREVTTNIINGISLTASLAF